MEAPITFRFLGQSLATAVLAVTVGCASAILVHAPEPVVVVDNDREDRRALGIPPGHLPPPGECRIWYPGRPPAHQPPPLSCADAGVRAPAGSWVLYRPA